MRLRKSFIFIVGFFLVFSFALAKPSLVLADEIPFQVEKNYDISGREKISAVLIKTTSKLYFYIDSVWWGSQNYQRQQEVLAKFESLSLEFENKIYPQLTSLFGSEWKPGVDGDERITILFHQMREDAGGYFRTADEYIKVQAPDSNEREMLYLPIGQIDNVQLKSLLAHELVHLITFNQKERLRGVSEEVWLNEARAEYAPVLLGYESAYQGSILERRIKIFLEQPSNSLTEWQNVKYDYGVANLFIRYLVDHYSVTTLADSLKSKKIGILSLNEVLKANGFQEDFSQIFTNWTIAVLLNNCSLDFKYCYLSENLKNFRLNPSVNFLPLSGRSSLSVADTTKNWTGNWQKFIGGNGILKLSFESLAGLNFKVPYLIEDKDGNYSINFLVLDNDEKGVVYISDFGTKNRSLTIIPSLQTKISGFDGGELTYSYSFTVASTERTPDQEEEMIKQLLEKIDFLKKEIIKIQAQINKILNKNIVSCSQISVNLSLDSGGSQVECLQEFLKNQGSEIYPEGLITGYFGRLTQSAVIRFQEKYSSEILAPYGLGRGTGIVGSATRSKINKILGGY